MLNGHAEVKPETSQRVRAAMVELGFVPSPLGRALRGGRTGIIGICFQALGSPIVARKIATLQHILRGAGFRALCELTDGNPGLELEVVRNFVAMKVDGIVLVGGLTEANATGIVTLLRRQKVPVVLVDPVERFELPTVELNREEGMRLALHHLLSRGHTKFGLLGIDEVVRYGQIRWRGIQRFVAQHDLALADQFIRFGEPEPAELDFSYGSRLAGQFLAMPAARRPTALVALNDQVAIGAMAQLQQAGLNVPRDVSMVGFDNLDVSAHVTPRLTTVDQHVEHMMQTAVELLTDHTSRAGDPEVEPRVIVPLLVERDSTAGAPQRRTAVR